MAASPPVNCSMSARHCRASSSIRGSVGLCPRIARGDGIDQVGPGLLCLADACLTQLIAPPGQLLLLLGGVVLLDQGDLLDGAAVDEAELDGRRGQAGAPIETSLSVASSAPATSSATDAPARRALP
jgi:hypothetical protein